MSDQEPGETIRMAKGYDPFRVQFPRTLHEVCPGELRFCGSPVFFVQKRETPGAVFRIYRTARLKFKEAI